MAWLTIPSNAAEEQPAVNVKPVDQQQQTAAPSGWLTEPFPTPQAMRPAVEAATRTDPDAFGKARALAVQTGLPTDTVERNMEDVESMAAAEAFMGHLAGAPATSSWLSKSSDNLKLASDSGESLSLIEHAVGKFRSLAASVPSSLGSSISGIGELNDIMNRSLIRAAESAGLTPVADGLRSLRQFAFETDIGRALNPAVVFKDVGGLLESAGTVVDVAPAQRDFGNEVASGIGQVATQITVAILTGGGSSTLMMIGQGVDQVADDVRAKGKEGTAEGDTAEVGGALVTGLTEKYGLDLLLKRIPAAVRSRIGRALAGMTTEAAQETVEQVMNNLIALQLYNPSQEIFGDDVLEGGAVGGAVGFITSAVIPGRRAQQRRAIMDDIKKEFDGSPMTERAKDAAVEHVEEVLKQEGVEIYIPAQALAEHVMGAGPGGSTSSQDVYESLGVADQIESALERGGDVKITEKAFADYVLDDQNYEALADHIRFGGGEMNVVEAEALKEEVKTDGKQDTGGTEKPAEAVVEGEGPSSEPETPAPGKAISEDQTKALEAAGFGEEEISKLTPEQAAELTGIPVETTPTQAADEAVTLAEEQLALKGMFETAQEAGLTSDKYAAYLAKVARAKEVSRQRQQKALTREAEKRASEEYKAQRQIEQAKVEESVNQRPVYSALNAIQAQRLDREAMVELVAEVAGGYGEFSERDIRGTAEVLDLLPKQDGGRVIYSSKNERGIDPEAFAAEHGFEDALDMVRAMLNAEPAAAVIERETNEAMNRKHGDLGNRLQGLREAMKSLHNDTQGEVLAAEVNALRNVKEGAVSQKTLIRAVRQRIGNFRLSEIIPSYFLAVETRKGREAGKAIRAGKRSEALRAKFQQLLNFRYAIEAYDIQGEIEKQRKQLANLTRPRKVHRQIDGKFLDQIRELLAPYNLEPRASNAERLEMMREAVRVSRETGQPLRIPPKLARDEFTTHYQDMTLNEWRILYDQVKFLETQGRREKELKTKAGLVAYLTAKTEMLAETDALPDTARTQNAVTVQNPGLLDRARSTLAALHVAFGKIELLIQRLDGGKIAGAWHKYVFQPIADAQTRELDMTNETLIPLMKELRKMSRAARRRLKATYYIPELDRKLSGSAILMIALNAGNESNYRKMLDGSAKDGKSKPWTHEGVQAALAKLGREEADLIQNIWNAFEKMRPLVEQVYQEENGIKPERIVGMPVKIGGKTLRGGYFPMIYDPNRTITPNRQTVLEMMQDPLIRGSVFSGMTQARVETYSAPVLLDINVLSHALRQGIHFVTHYQAVKNVDKILRDKDLAGAIRSKLGVEYHQGFQSWLEAVATNGADNSGSKKVNAVYKWFRSAQTVARLGFSFTTAVTQVFGLATSVSVLGQEAGGKFKGRTGADYMALGLERYMTNPAETTRTAFELSGEIRHRIGNADRDMADHLSRLSGRTGIWSQIQRASLVAIGGIQLYTVDIPTWTAGFNKALDQGMNEADAVRFADSVLRTSQASGHVKDLSSIQRQHGLMRIVTMFSTYTMLLYHLQVQTLGNAAKIKNLPGVVSRLMWLVALPTVAEAFLRNEGPGDDEEQPIEWWALRVLKYALNSVSIAGRGVSSMMDGHRFTITPIEDTALKMPEAFDALTDLFQSDEEFSVEDARKVLDGFGLLLGVPGTTQMVRALKAIESEDAGLYDFLVGVKQNQK